MYPLLRGVVGAVLALANGDTYPLPRGVLGPSEAVVEAISIFAAGFRAYVPIPPSEKEKFLLSLSLSLPSFSKPLCCDPRECEPSEPPPCEFPVRVRRLRFVLGLRELIVLVIAILIPPKQQNSLFWNDAIFSSPLHKIFFFK